MLALLVLLPIAHAETADEVIAKARAANRVESSVQTVQMTIVPKSGAQRTRELLLKSRREGDVAKTYMKILSPSDVAGMAFVMVDNPGQVDQTLAYTPSFKVVNQISGASRKGAFVNSDFTYEDLELRESATGTMSMASETAEAWVIDTQLAAGSSYSKVRTTIHKADLVPHKVEFFDSSGVLVKVLEVKRTEKTGNVTLPVETEMTNVQKGSRTVLVIKEHRLGVPKSELPDETFTREYLQRGG